MADPTPFIVAPDAIWRIAAFLGMCGGGYLIIRALGLHLPLPKTFYDLVLFSYWNYPPEVERSRITANKIAWFCIWLVAALMFLIIF